MTTFGAPRRARAAGAVSQGTEDVLAQLLGESKLSLARQKQILGAARTQGPLASAGALVNSGPLSEPSKDRRVAQRRLAVHKRAQAAAADAEAAARRPAQGIGRRSVNDIKASLARDPETRERAAPPPGLARGRDNDAEKERLAFRNWIKPKSDAEQDALLAGTSYARAAAQSEARATHGLSDFAMREREADELAAQIAERQDFLAAMEAAGHAHLYRARIEREISLRLAQLRRVDPVNGERGFAPVPRAPRRMDG